VRQAGSPRGGAAARRAAAAALAALAALSGCAARRPAAVAAAYPYGSSEARVFYATAEGLTETPPREAPELASRAPNASVLSSDGRTMAAAINGWGVARIEAAPAGAPAAPGGGAYRIVGSPRPSDFAGLTAAGAWPLAGGFLVQLFRDPFSDGAPPASHLRPPPTIPAARVLFIGGDDGAVSPLEPIPAEPGYELFAFLPSGGRWFAELRRDGPDRVDLEFLSLADPLAPPRAGSRDGIAKIMRADFEAALKPRSLADLGESRGAALRSALASLGRGPWLVRLRTSAGEDGWYLSAGKPDEAMAVFAWAEPGRTAALRFDGWLAASDDGGRIGLIQLAVPVPGAVFTSLAAAGDLAAASWEAGEFPYLSSAGLVIAPVPR
jgi:hypothetical protein